MDNYKHLIIIKGKPKDDVFRCYYDSTSRKTAVIFNSDVSSTYYYNCCNVKCLNSIGELNASNLRLSLKSGQQLNNVIRIVIFNGENNKYYRIFFKNGTFRSYNAAELEIMENQMALPKVKSIMGYYAEIAEITGLKSDDGTNILRAKFSGFDFISSNTVLAKYLKGEDGAALSNKCSVIFPFGCNISQMAAVRNAMNNQISIIEGPPGTGKTQTILNIIANIIIRGQTVAVVSNNNSATDNVFEKLQKYHYDYIAAQLGNDKNKIDFINSKQQECPNLEPYRLAYYKKSELSSRIELCENKLEALLEIQNSIATRKSSLSALKTEKAYFDEYFDASYKKTKIFNSAVKTSSNKILTVWNKIQSDIEKNKNVGFFYKLKLIIAYGFSVSAVYSQSVTTIIEQLKRLFYESRIPELETEIYLKERQLDENRISDVSAELFDMSDRLFRAALADKYNSRSVRPVFTADDLWKRGSAFLKEYPVILSTTFSAKSSLRNITYDYVIVDEASQVDLTTGVLAMSCAKNIVVVGDLMQLPNVVPEDIRKNVSCISNASGIADNYRYEENSLLSSVCRTFSNAPKTLLREHYRCHPKIIEFCNRKFYNNQLIVMTEDKGEKDVLKAYITARGNHARGHLNMRQIEEIKTNILPELNSDDVGIIAPYRRQTAALSSIIDNDIDISTVHKFQGREKDDIIISTVDNEITEFTDNPNMLNVAVSRAKKRLRVVVSDNDANDNTNIGDLVRYIKYNNFEVKHSEIYSVFDLLYKGFEEKRKEYLKKHNRISEYDSENLVYGLIKDVLGCEKFSKLDVISHQPLNSLICDISRLDSSEINYVKNPLTHIDFLIFSSIDRAPILAVEVDGYAYHKENSTQSKRDLMKDLILKKYGIPILRLSTIGCMEKEKLSDKLAEII